MIDRMCHGWGGVNHGRPLHTVAPTSAHHLKQLFANNGQSSYLARGLGRSYGDCALNSDGVLIDCRFLNHFLSFDAESGALECESGVSIQDINRLLSASGWMLPVTPGTQFVTVGGAIGNDVHGKNHVREGSFGVHLIALKLARSNGEIIECSAKNNSTLFAATIGGLGLTGLIVSAKLQLRPVQSLTMHTNRIPFKSLAELFHLVRDQRDAWEYHIAWMDPATGCHSGHYMTANHSDQPGALKWPRQRNFKLGIMAALPSALPGRLLMKAANFRYRKGFKAGPRQSSAEAVLYPLDRLPEWNFLFGKKGFFQYQCVFPEATAETAIDTILKVIDNSSHSVTLAVGKWFGSRTSPGLLSFPLPGFSITLDFVNKGSETQGLLSSLDDIVANFNGRIYPAKDGRMPAALFAGGYPQLDSFRQHLDPLFASDFWRRMDPQA